MNDVRDRAALRAQLSDVFISSLRETWDYMDRDDVPEEHYRSIIRGGSRQFLAGQFDERYDSVSLALALLTLARQRFLATGFKREGDPVSEHIDDAMELLAKRGAR